MASRHTREAGVFRVNYRTGEMSICFVLVKKEQVVCTQQAKPGAEASSDAPLTGPAPGRGRGQRHAGTGRTLLKPPAPRRRSGPPCGVLGAARPPQEARLPRMRDISIHPRRPGDRP